MMLKAVMAESPKQPEQQRPSSEEAFRVFFADEKRILSDLAGGTHFTFKRGDGWSINPETGEGTYDEKFFTQRGYTPTQALFAAFHEIDHVRELAELLETQGGQKIWAELKAKKERRERTHLLWHFVTIDPADNKRILRLAPSLDEDVTKLYQKKLFPTADFRDLPLHLQMIHAILRKSMLPDEDISVDPKVTAAIEKIRHTEAKTGEERDVIELVTHPDLPLATKIKLVERFVEPLYESLFQEDVRQQQEKQKKKSGEQGKVEDSDKNGDPAERPFKPLYRKLAEQFPSPMNEGELEQKIKEAKEQQSESARQAAGYETEHGVSKEDLANYYDEYRHVEGYLEQLRDVFRRIVEQRKIPRRRLAALKGEGVMIDPGLVAQTYMDVRAGVDSPKTMKDFEGNFIEENIPGKFSLRLVADQSRSMAGEKSIHQRRSVILVMEALKEFFDILDEERAGLSIDLDVQTELRSFGVKEGTRLYKPLARELSEKQRVEFFKGLLETSGGTNDYDALAEIEKDIKRRLAQDNTYAAELKSGKRREIVIVLSDGNSGNAAEVKNRSQNLRELGVKVVGLGMGSRSQSIESTYAPEGRICYDISDLPKTLQDLLEEYLGQLSITGNPEDLRRS